MSGGPEDVVARPPEGLIRAQRLAIETAEAACVHATSGMTEIELAEWANDHASRHGAVGFWDSTLVGFGPGTLRCFPTEKPTERILWNLDLGHIDILPVTEDGWWGDAARTLVRGDNPAQHELLATVQEIHDGLLASTRPGMRACDLHAIYARAVNRVGLLELDRLGNVGHSLGRETSYDQGYIDPWNTTEMWGAWAIEPFVGNHIQAVKLEDVVWFGPEGCVLVR